MKLHIWIVAGLTAGQLFISGCGAKGPTELQWDTVTSYTSTTCDDTFSPSPEVYDMTEWALDKWQQATGKELCTDPSEGVPIRFTDDVVIDDKSVCGNTSQIYDYSTNEWLYTDYIELTRKEGIGCISTKRTLLHEIGHAIAHQPRGEVYHTSSYSVMAEVTNSTLEINESAVQLICRHSDCPAIY